MKDEPTVQRDVDLQTYIDGNEIPPGEVTESSSLGDRLQNALSEGMSISKRHGWGTAGACLESRKLFDGFPALLSEQLIMAECLDPEYDARRLAEEVLRRDGGSRFMDDDFDLSLCDIEWVKGRRFKEEEMWAWGSAIPTKDRARLAEARGEEPLWRITISLAAWVTLDDSRRRRALFDAMECLTLRRNEDGAVRGPSTRITGTTSSPAAVALYGLKERREALVHVAAAQHKTTGRRLAGWELGGDQVTIFDVLAATVEKGDAEKAGVEGELTDSVKRWCQATADLDTSMAAVDYPEKEADKAELAELCALAKQQNHLKGGLRARRKKVEDRVKAQLKAGG